MKPIFFTPGPTELHPKFKQYLSQAISNNIFSISHRSEAFHKVYRETTSVLKKLLNIPQNHEIFFLSSATEAMERVIENGVLKYNIHFVNGAFSQRFYQTSRELKKTPEIIEVEWGKSFDFNNLKINKKAELLCFTHNETSTGVSHRMSDIYDIKRRYIDKLIAVDIVSSVPYINMNYSYTDYVFFSVQKGFGMPSGLGVIIVSPKAIDKSRYLEKKGISTGTYHNFNSLLKYGIKMETPETPNVFLIYLLGKIASDMLKKGIKEVRKETEFKAELLYNFFDNQDIYEVFVNDKSIRSQTVLVVKSSNNKHLIEKLKKKGIIIGRGYGTYKDQQIRIANFPQHSVNNVKRLIKCISQL